MRTKSNRMELIQKMNLCGQDLENVAVLRNMPNLEVISLSVNKLRTLADFSECPKLAELYVRKNDIRDLAEVQHLMHLRHLRVLWLSDNPCTILPHYRAYVLHHLPGLTKLDSSDVTDDERRNAARADMECVPTCLGQEPDSGCVAEPCDRADASSESRDQRAPRRATESGGSISRHMQSHTSAAPHRFSSPPELPTETEGMNERKPQMSNSRRSVRPGGFQDSAAAAHNDRALHPVHPLRGERSPGGAGHFVEPVQNGLHEEGSLERLPPENQQFRSDYNQQQGHPLNDLYHNQAWQDRPQQAWLAGVDEAGSPTSFAGGSHPHARASAANRSQARAPNAAQGDWAAEVHDRPPAAAAADRAARADNILCAVLALIKELDKQGLELVRRAIEQRQCEH